MKANIEQKIINKTPVESHLLGMDRLLNSGILLNKIQKSDKKFISMNDRRYLNFASGSYLGLNHNINFFDYLKLKKEGIRSPFSRISGISKYANQLEENLNKIFNKKIYTAQSISLINMNIFLTLGQIFDVAVMDSDAHSTLINGVKCSKMKYKKFDHNNLSSLEENLSLSNKPLIVLDGLYSMKGDLPKLNEINILAKKYNATILIDDAHGFGVLGENGYGVMEHFDLLKEKNMIYIGSFSKACSNPVGFVAVDDSLEKLFNSSFNASIFSGPPCNLNLILSCKHLNNFKNEKFKIKRKNISKNVRFFQRNLELLGVKYFGDENSPIVGVRFNSIYFEELISLLDGKKILTKPAIFPVVKIGSELIRFTITESHNLEDLEYILKVISSNLHYFILEH